MTTATGEHVAQCPCITLSRYNKRFRLIVVFSLIISWTHFTALAAEESVCFGTVSNGWLENGVKLPIEGNNFSTYSSLGSMLGRTYIHSKVAEIVLAAYQTLERSTPGKIFVYGETGWSSGGRIRPHRTHKNGLSVDFMVPIVDASGKSVHLPTSILNKYGYNIDFDTKGRYGNYFIDFETMAEHVYQLDVEAKAKEAGIALVIFEPLYLPKLFATKRGNYLKANINFMKGKAWIRHDEHYHVDFSVACKPLQG
jgi:penicillin-insensitive murein DD-endopeptidase